MRATAAAIGLLIVLLPSAPGQAQPAPSDEPKIGQESRDSVWVPTPERVIRRMLQMADTTSRDLVVDLGAGDGRIPIYAAKHFGARAVGVELEGNLVRLARREAASQGVSHLATFQQEDLFKADLSRATVIALYISPGAMSRLKPACSSFARARASCRTTSRWRTGRPTRPSAWRAALRTSGWFRHRCEARGPASAQASRSP
jgi:hypothetical protein